MTALATLGRFGLFVAAFSRAVTRRPPPLRASVAEAYRIGVQSLPILLVISAFMGTDLAVQGYSALAGLGGQQLVGMFVALTGIRELAPIMAAAMIAAKAGTEMASAIAVMRIEEEIDALEVMAVSPHWYLVTPRLLGILLVLPALTILSIFTLLFAAWLVAVFQLGLDGDSFLSFAVNTTELADFGFCTLKALCFGLVICLVSCFYGFNSPPGAQGVGQATNAAVVVSAVVCALANYLLSEVLYG